MRKHKCIEGDVIDAICREEYGTEHGTTEAVLAYNPGLSSYLGRLPEGLVITLPDIQKATEVKLLRLWE